MFQNSPYAHGVPSFQLPVTPPSNGWDQPPLIQVCLSEEWAAYVAGALKQLLLQSTWDTDSPNYIDFLQQNAFSLISQFQGGVTDSICPPPPCPEINWIVDVTATGGFEGSDGMGCFVVKFRQGQDNTGGYTAALVKDVATVSGLEVNSFNQVGGNYVRLDIVSIDVTAINLSITDCLNNVNTDNYSLPFHLNEHFSIPQAIKTALITPATSGNMLVIAQTQGDWLCGPA